MRPESVIGYDARALTASKRSVMTGVERYSANLLSALVATGLKIHAFGAPSRLAGHEHVDISRSRLAENGVLWGALGLGLMTVRHRVDALVIPEQYVPAIRACPTIVVVHDVAYERFPQMYSPRLRRALRAATWHAIRAADHLVADSMTTKTDLVDILGVPPQKITVIYPGIDHGFRPGSCDVTELTRPFILYVGSIHRRKNLRVLIDALPHLPDLQLVCAGHDGAGYSQVLHEQARALGVDSRVTFLGYIPDERLKALFGAALLVVMPSHYEGFGLPALEAMAAGVPVVVSAGGALPEVVGPAGLVFDGSEPLSLVHAVQVAASPTRRRELIEAGLARANTFTWAATASQFLDVLTRTVP